MEIEYITGLIIAVLLFMYLFYVIIKPGKFKYYGTKGFYTACGASFFNRRIHTRAR
ncbi:MAG: K(+)-transporting ATPase subunit F [Ignavibacteria bacterium]